MTVETFRHPNSQHEHPGRVVALRTRTRWFGTVNLALALRGRSCGWGTCARPRRWFVGHTTVNRRGGNHFVKVTSYAS